MTCNNCNVQYVGETTTPLTNVRIDIEQQSQAVNIFLTITRKLEWEQHFQSRS